VNDTHEVLPNAPLALVAVEIRFPDGMSAQPLPTNVRRSFRDLLGEEWVLESQTVHQLAFTIGPGGAVPQTAAPITIPRFSLRDRTLAVAVTEQSMTVETTRYRHYPTFREVVKRATDAVGQVLKPDGIARVGMRYIDEIRVPGPSEDDPSSWRQWVDLSLLAPQIAAMADAGFASVGWEGAAQYQTGPEQRLVLRYGPRTGYVVNPQGPLRRPSVPPPGPLFMLDFDCYWEPVDIPQFDPETIMSTCDELRRPIRALFDLLTTNKLYKEFVKETDDA
jgi:uncharacterized protein (TIGR04255 family)